ncbi:peptide MFS transporter [Hephaestia mangrovi]|uniref:peptide MFS transporter n=1 Tax=Hephaestia mangrovi TaxID=2873268 RepID=UPI001CA6255C|nr:peptide MFS transporter [Hephaestia mangrovi]MBY8828243.1 peptide MFS transporter [Hephaestia mangrovi]
MVETPTADSPAEPDISHVNPMSEKTWMGHPKQLARLFSIEMWERFGFYGMRALLVLYLTKHFLFQDHEANGLVGGYLSLVYLTPVVGGLLADRYLGSKRAVKWGAIVMAIGYFMLCFGGQQAKPYATIDGTRYEVSQAPAATTLTPNTAPQTIAVNGETLTIHGLPDGSVELLAPNGQVTRTLSADQFVAGADRSPFNTTLLLFALGLIVIGNGFFKPNISTIVGALYAPGDKRRDAGFTIFYAGINIGSILGQIACPFLANHFGWWAGFLCVSVVLLVGWATAHFDGGRLDGYGEPPTHEGPDRALLIYVLSIVSVVVFWLIFRNVMTTPEAAAGSGIWGYIVATPLLGKALLVIFLAAVIGIPIWSWKVGDTVEFQMMLAAIILVIFNVTFWALFEQAASSLTLFADRNTTLELFGFSMNAATTQQFNPIVVVLFAPVMSYLWLWLAKRGWEPSIQVKFALALMLVGLGFVVLSWSGTTANEAFRVSLWWLVLTYFLHSIAELCISPVGLSMITKLAIARVVGMMMGVWFLSISVGEYLAGAAAQAASVETVGGQVTNPELALHTYMHTFMTGGELTIGAGVVLLVISPWLKKLMHGVT